MAFPKPTRPVPTEVGTIVIVLKDIPESESRPAMRTASFELRLVDGAGQVADTVQGDLLPHLTAAQATSLNNFMDAMRTKATEALP